MWMCEWEEIYGVYPVENAWKADDAEFVITQEGDKICVPCAEKWHAGKKQQQIEDAKAKERKNEVQTNIH